MVGCFMHWSVFGEGFAPLMAERLGKGGQFKMHTYLVEERNMKGKKVLIQFDKQIRAVPRAYVIGYDRCLGDGL